MLTACREIEDFMKGSSGQVGKSSEEVIAEFLLGKSPLTSQAAAELPSLNLDAELDTGSNMQGETPS
jgi:hypothetical protein